MTLGQFAVAVGATPRWVLNALTRLSVPRRYDEPLARRLALARTLHDSAALPLTRAWAEAARILTEADYFKDWTTGSDDGSVTLVVHLPRIFTNYQARLALARSSHAAPKRRGRPPSRKGSAIERARAYGIDLTLLDSQLTQAPAQRVREMDANNQALGEWRKSLRP